MAQIFIIIKMFIYIVQVCKDLDAANFTNRDSDRERT